jgi:hypothetical protein
MRGVLADDEPRPQGHQEDEDDDRCHDHRRQRRHYTPHDRIVAPSRHRRYESAITSSPVNV